MNSILCCLHWVPNKLFSCWVLALVVHNVPLTGNGLSAIWIKVKIEIHLACIKGRRKRGCSKFCFLPSSSSGNNDVALIEKDIIDKFSFREVTWCQESPVKAFFNLQKPKAIFSSNVSCSFREQNFPAGCFISPPGVLFYSQIKLFLKQIKSCSCSSVDVSHTFLFADGLKK